jgi:hypothetical protein
MCYIDSRRKRPTVWLDASDRAALSMMRERYGVARESDARRLAVRILAESTRVHRATPDKRKLAP